MREGSTSRWSASSRGVIQSSMLLTVRERYVHRLTSPCVSAQKARCGWTAVISASLDGSPFHFSTCSVTKASVYGASPSGVSRCRTPLVVMFRPLPLNMALASGRLSSFTRSQDFSRLMWQPNDGPCSRRASHQCRILRSVPPPAASSANQTCVAPVGAVRSIRGRTAIANIAMANRSPWVVPSRE